MHFELTEEQRLIQDSALRFVADNYSLEDRRSLSATEQGFSDAHWATMAELGWLALPFDEEDGGMGGSAIDAMVLADVLGQGLVLEPYLATVTLAGGLLARLGNASQKQTLEALIGGETRVAAALLETQGRYNLADIKTHATATADGYKIVGEKSMVVGAPGADRLIVLARTAGEQCDETGLSLFLIDTSSEGVSISNAAMIDEQRAGFVSINVNVAKDALLGEENNCWPALLATIDSVLGAACAEAVGMMDRVNAETAEYLKTRKQFGQPLGAFQVLQHRYAEMQVAAEEARSLSYKANITLKMRDQGECSTEEAAKTIAVAKAKVMDYGMKIVKDSLQIHGGMGMTDELSIGHYYKRMMSLSMLFGNSDHYRRRYAALVAA